MYELHDYIKLIKVPTLPSSFFHEPVGVMSLFPPNGNNLRRSPNPPFLGVSSPFIDPGVAVRLRGGDPNDDKKPPSPSVAAEAVARAVGIGFGVAGVPTDVRIETLGSISRADKKEVVSRSLRVDVVVRN